MLRFIKERLQISRVTIVGIVYIYLMFILLSRLYSLQIIEGDNYEVNYVERYNKQRNIQSTRGNIYDRNGTILASNRLSYSLVMTDQRSYESTKEKQMTLNGAIYQVLKKLNEYNEELNREFYITLDASKQYSFTVSGSRLDRFKADVYGRSKVSDLTTEEKESTPEEIISYLASQKKFALYKGDGELYTEDEIQQYGVSNNYTKQEVLDIITYRYMLSLNAYQKYVPITIATDLCEEMVVYILENMDTLAGMDIETTSIREYEGGEAFAHILGYVGKISEEELETLGAQNEDYTSESIVGKTGIEKYLETTLHGINGIEEFTVNQKGEITDEPKIIQEMVSGSDVYLSIDKELQLEVYQILERQLADILLSNIINAKKFDRSNIKEVSEIRIPIYDVYFALVNNNIIDITQLQNMDATEFEREIGQRFYTQKHQIVEELYNELAQKSTEFNQLIEAMKEYQRYITDTLIIENLELIDQSQLDKTHSTYLDWRNGVIGIKEYLLCALKEQWIHPSQLIDDEGFYDTEELYELLISNIMLELEDDLAFDKLIYKSLIQGDVITGRDLGILLYEQGILSKEDTDYERLVKNTMSGYSFMRQKIDALEITPGMLALDPYSASAVVVDPNTGSVLACVSYPGYDNNKLANQMDVAYYNQLYNDLSIPLFNRATQQLTAPGSTFKPITVVAGLKESVINAHTSIFCDGIFDKTVTSLRCWKRTGHGEISDIASALSNSCNDYLCDIAYRLGSVSTGGYSEEKAMQQLQKYAVMFDLDKKSGIEIFESEPQISQNYAIASSIGQGTHNFSTVQLARYISTLANQGTSYSLSLIDRVVSGDVIEKNHPEIISEIQLSSSIWTGISNGLRQFAEDDSILKSLTIPVAGKTGTAQESKSRPDHALFVGYAPAEAPEISVAVRIANGYKSATAVKATKEIISYYFNLDE